MDAAGGVPEPLLPPQIALQNPKLIGGESFRVLPELGRIVVMLDHDGDENYEPFLIPIDGGFPEPVAAEAFANTRSHLIEVDTDAGIAYFAVESREEPLIYARRCDLATGDGRDARPEPVRRVPGRVQQRPLARRARRPVPPRRRRPLRAGGRTGARSSTARRSTSASRGANTPPPGIGSTHITPSARGMLLTSAIFDDAGSPGYLDFSRPGEVEPVAFDGLVHTGAGELEQLQHLDGDRYAAIFNIDGCSWVYDVRFDEPARRLAVDRVLVGEGDLAGGVLHGLDLDEESGSFALSFCTATMPTQLYVHRRDAASRGRASARSASRRSCSPPARTPRSTRTTASASPPASTCRPSASATTGRGRSSTSSTAARRARSGPTSPGSRCR